MENKNSKNNQVRQAKVSNQNQTNNKDLVDQTAQQNINNKSNTQKQKPANNKKTIITAIIIFGLTFLVALLGKLLGGKMIEGRINPPAYPPDRVFFVVWAILYVLIALATFIFYKNNHDTKKRNCALIWYGVHLFFNLFWPLFYFRLDMLIVSCFILLAMVITAIVLTFKYFRNNLISGWLFTIYTLWLLYAMYLNLAITLLNV